MGGKKGKGAKAKRCEVLLGRAKNGQKQSEKDVKKKFEAKTRDGSIRVRVRRMYSNLPPLPYTTVNILTISSSFGKYSLSF